MCNNSPKDKISAEELRTIVKLKSVGECLQDRRLQCLDIQKERKRLLGLVSAEPSRLAVALPANDQGNME